MKTQIEFKSEDGLTKGTELPTTGSYVLKFWAEWCNPCKALSPIVEELVKEFDLPVYAVNVDKNSFFTQKYNVRGIPHMVFVKDGEIQETITGNKTKAELIPVFNKYKNVAPVVPVVEDLRYSLIDGKDGFYYHDAVKGTDLTVEHVLSILNDHEKLRLQHSLLERDYNQVVGEPQV